MHRRMATIQLIMLTLSCGCSKGTSKPDSGDLNAQIKVLQDDLEKARNEAAEAKAKVSEATNTITKQLCLNCKGTGLLNRKCTTCAGSGTIKCKICDGTGYDAPFRIGTCNRCRGTKVVWCPGEGPNTTPDDTMTYSPCCNHGTYNITCNVCNGKKFIEVK